MYVPLSISLWVATATGSAGPASIPQALQESLLSGHPHDAVSTGPNVKEEANMSSPFPSLAVIVFRVPAPYI